MVSNLDRQLPHKLLQLFALIYLKDTVQQSLQNVGTHLLNQMALRFDISQLRHRDQAVTMQ